MSSVVSDVTLRGRLALAEDITGVPDGGISTDKLADGAVTGPKIAQGAVTFDKMNVTIGYVVADGDLTISLA